MPAAPGAIKLHRRDVDRFMLQHRRDLRHVPGLIQIVHNERRKIAAEIGLQSVDLPDVDPPAADRLPDDLQLLPACRGQHEFCRIGMRPLAQIDSAEMKGHPGLLRECETLRNPRVRHIQSEQTRHQRPVRAVPAPSGEERSVQQNIRVHDRLSHQFPADIPDPDSASRMRTRRSHHHGTDHLKYIHEPPPRKRQSLLRA